MFTVDELLSHYYPALTGYPVVGAPLRGFLRFLLKEKQLTQFAEQHPRLQGMDFIEQLLEHFNFTYTVADRERENIPVSGRVMIIANHPLGTLDGLALLKLVHDCRTDVRIVANELLETIRPLRSFLLSVRVLSGVTLREQIGRIGKALEQDEAVIIFPAGEVSRLGPQGVRDGTWQRGFLRLATRTRSPILPIHIKGRNSLLFYAASALSKPLSTLMLVREMFRQQDNQIAMTIGALIPHSSYEGMTIREKEKIGLLKKHLYHIGAGKKAIFRTVNAVARPERRITLKRELEKGELLGRTPDGKEIFLYATADYSPVLREIARLREVTFRSVGEGSGKRRDTDSYDRYYRHLLLWSADDLEIVGAYRFADATEVIRSRGHEGLYVNSLFHFQEETPYFLENGLELGRSFIQQKYWGKRSLDYLWYGIGAFLQRNPQYRYLFGPVSISNAMPPMAKELLIYFYTLYFAAPQSGRCSRNPFRFSVPVADLAGSFCGTDYQRDFIHLKSLLGAMGTSIPTLYKQYTELCVPGGVVFLDFNVDKAFNNCIDGLVVVDTLQLKPVKRDRYIKNSFLQSS